MALCHLSMMRTFRKVSAIWLLIMGMISTIYGVSDTAEAASIYSILNELDKMIQDSASKSTRNIQDSSAQCAQLLIAQKQDDQNKSYKPKETSGAAEDAKLEEVKEILKEVSSPAEQIAPEQLVIDNMAKTIKESSLDQNATLNAITQRIAQLYWSDPITAKQFFAEQIDALFASLIDIILNHGSFAYLDLKNMKIFDEYDPRAVHPFVTLQILSWSFFRLNVDSELDRLINNGVINFLKYFLDQDIMLDGEQQTTISAISEQLAKHKSITSPHQQQIITDLYRKWAAQDGEHYFVQKEIARDFSYLVDPATQKYAPFFNKLANQEEVEEFIAAKPKNTSFYINHVAQTVKSHQDNLTYPRTRNLIHRQYAVDLSRFVSLNDLQSDDYFQILSNIEHPELIFVDKYFISAQLPYLFENPAFPPAFGKALQNISSSNIWPVRGTGQDYTNYAQAWEKNLRDYFDPFVGVFQEVDRLAHRHHPEMDRGLPPEYWPAYQELLNFIHHKIDPSSSEMALADQELVAQGESMVDQIASWSNLPPVEADTLSSKMNGSAKRELGDSDILLAPNEDLANHPLPGARWYLETLHTLAHLANPQDSESLFVFYNILNKLGSNTSLGLKALELNTESLSILHDLYPAVKRQGSFKNLQVFGQAIDRLTKLFPGANQKLKGADLKSFVRVAHDYIAAYPEDDFNADLVGFYTDIMQRFGKKQLAQEFQQGQDSATRLTILTKFVRQLYLSKDLGNPVNRSGDYDFAAFNKQREKIEGMLKLFPAFTLGTYDYQALVFDSIRQLDAVAQGNLQIVRLIGQAKEKEYFYQMLEQVMASPQMIQHLKKYFAEHAQDASLSATSKMQLLDLAILSLAQKTEDEFAASSVLVRHFVTSEEEQQAAWYKILQIIEKHYASGQNPLTLIKDLQNYLNDFYQNPAPSTKDALELQLLDFDPQQIFDDSTLRYNLVLRVQLTNAHVTAREFSKILISFINPSRSLETYEQYESSMANIFIHNLTEIYRIKMIGLISPMPENGAGQRLHELDADDLKIADIVNQLEAFETIERDNDFMFFKELVASILPLTRQDKELATVYENLIDQINEFQELRAGDPQYVSNERMQRVAAELLRQAKSATKLLQSSQFERFFGEVDDTMTNKMLDNFTDYATKVDLRGLGGLLANVVAQDSMAQGTCHNEDLQCLRYKNLINRAGGLLLLFSKQFTESTEGATLADQLGENASADDAPEAKKSVRNTNAEDDYWKNIPQFLTPDNFVSKLKPTPYEFWQIAKILAQKEGTKHFPNWALNSKNDGMRIKAFR